jgi:membrane protein DedA with SNARE-associated domain
MLEDPALEDTAVHRPAPDGSQPELDTSISPEQWKIARRCLSVLGVLGVGSMIGSWWLFPYLVTHYPLLLIALSPLGRHLVLVAPQVDVLLLVVVTLLRRVAFYVPSFYLGRSLGDAGFKWIEARAGSFAGYVRWVERMFARFRYPVIVVAAGGMVSMLAGISGMRLPLFLALALPGLIVRILVVILFADYYREPIEWILALISEYWLPATIAMVFGATLYQWIKQQRARA